MRSVYRVIFVRTDCVRSAVDTTKIARPIEAASTANAKTRARGRITSRAARTPFVAYRTTYPRVRVPMACKATRPSNAFATAASPTATASRPRSAAPIKRAGIRAWKYQSAV